MRKQLRILLAGAVVVIPFAITVWLAIAMGTWLDDLARRPLAQWGVPVSRGVGVLIVLAGLYIIGLLTRFWVFRGLVSLLERIVERVPGIKTIYESVRDLLKLFGGDARHMGRVVLYTAPGSPMTLLAILTSDKPKGISDVNTDLVAIFLPFSYMFGGITVYVPASCLREMAMPVEEALKLCATAQVTSPNLVLGVDDDADDRNGHQETVDDSGCRE